MARENGAHVEYDPAGNGDGPEIERVWGSKLRALESAVEEGNKYAFVQYGETLAAALARINKRPTIEEALEAVSKVKPSTGGDVPRSRGPEPRAVKDNPQA